jgi:Na+/H+-translocating membrane pyrophosphatase
MQNAISWLLYAVFAIVLVAMYLGIRRRWLSPTLIASIGVLLSIILMTLVSVAQGNNAYQALFVGFLIGGLFSVGTLIMAMYFTRSEARRKGQG